jgi:hypothetical protein
MGVMKNQAIEERNDSVVDYHTWRFVEASGGADQHALDWWASSYARRADTADHAVDVMEKPHHYAEQIAEFASIYAGAYDDDISLLGSWECEECGEESKRLTHTIDMEKTCYGQA